MRKRRQVTTELSLEDYERVERARVRFRCLSLAEFTRMALLHMVAHRRSRRAAIETQEAIPTSRTLPD